METGQTIFFKEVNSIFKTRDTFNHVGILYKIGNELYVMESKLGGNRNIKPLSIYIGTEYIVLDTSKLWHTNKHHILNTISDIEYTFVTWLKVKLKYFLSNIGINLTINKYADESSDEYISKAFNIPIKIYSIDELYHTLFKEYELKITFEGKL